MSLFLNPAENLKSLALLLIDFLDALKVKNPILFYTIHLVLWVLFLSISYGYLEVGSWKESLMISLGILISSIGPRTTYVKNKNTKQ